MNSQAKERGRGIFWFAVLTASAAYLAVIMGAAATSSCSPSASGGFIQTWAQINDAHRYLAYLATALTLALAGALMVKEKRRWLKILGVLAALTVIAQAALGSLEARHLDLPLAISHSCLAQIYFCLVVSLAIFTHPKWRWERREGHSENAVAAASGRRSSFFNKIRRPEAAATTQNRSYIEGRKKLRVRLIAVGFSLIVFAQVVLGAIYRDEVQIPSRGIRGMGVLPHMIGGGIVLAVALWLLVSVLNLPTRETGLMVLTVGLAIFVMVQVFLGIGVYMMMRIAESSPRAIAAGNYATGGPIMAIVIATVMHAALGTLIFAGSVAAACLTHRRAAPPAIMAAQA